MSETRAISISRETYERLQDEAAEQGLSLPQYVQKLMDNQTISPKLAEWARQHLALDHKAMKDHTC